MYLLLPSALCLPPFCLFHCCSSLPFSECSRFVSPQISLSCDHGWIPWGSGDQSRCDNQFEHLWEKMSMCFPLSSGLMLCSQTDLFSDTEFTTLLAPSSVVAHTPWVVHANAVSAVLTVCSVLSLCAECAGVINVA